MRRYAAGEMAFQLSNSFGDQGDNPDPDEASLAAEAEVGGSLAGSGISLPAPSAEALLATAYVQSTCCRFPALSADALHATPYGHSSCCRFLTLSDGALHATPYGHFAS